jgi:hypothetical protein
MNSLLRQLVSALKDFTLLLCSFKLLDIPLNLPSILVNDLLFDSRSLLLTTIVSGIIEQIFLRSITLPLSFEQVDSRHALASKVPLNLRFKSNDLINYFIILNHPGGGVVQQIADRSLGLLKHRHRIVVSGQQLNLLVLLLLTYYIGSILSKHVIVLSFG